MFNRSRSNGTNDFGDNGTHSSDEYGGRNDRADSFKAFGTGANLVQLGRGNGSTFGANRSAGQPTSAPPSGPRYGNSSRNDNDNGYDNADRIGNSNIHDSRRDSAPHGGAGGRLPQMADDNENWCDSPPAVQRNAGVNYNNNNRDDNNSHGTKNFGHNNSNNYYQDDSLPPRNNSSSYNSYASRGHNNNSGYGNGNRFANNNNDNNGGGYRNQQQSNNYSDNRGSAFNCPPQRDGSVSSGGGAFNRGPRDQNEGGSAFGGRSGSSRAFGRGGSAMGGLQSDNNFICSSESTLSQGGVRDRGSAYDDRDSDRNGSNNDAFGRGGSSMRSGGGRGGYGGGGRNNPPSEGGFPSRGSMAGGAFGRGGSSFGGNVFCNRSSSSSIDAAFGNNTSGAALGRGGSSNSSSTFGRGGSSATFGRGGGTAGGAFPAPLCDSFFQQQANYDANQNKDTPLRDGSNQEDTAPSHIPRLRDVNEIFAEDIQSADNYSQIRAEDDNVVVTGLSDGVIVAIQTWDEANLEKKLLANITRAKYAVPRKIQSYAIPTIMDGFDVKGHAETGSGKTAAFLIPIINQVIRKKTAGEFKSQRSKPYALIFEPTRELAIQLFEQSRKLTYDTGVSTAVAYGKYLRRENLRAISLGCDILIGTVGRLTDFISNEYVLMDELKVVILDEADRLLEDNEFMRLFRYISVVRNFPDKYHRQTLLFSATFSETVQKFADELLRDHNVMISNKKYASANSKVIQHFEMVSGSEQKKELLIKLLKAELEERHKDIKTSESAQRPAGSSEKNKSEKSDATRPADSAEELSSRARLAGKFSEEFDEDGQLARSLAGASVERLKKPKKEARLRRTLIFVQKKRDADIIALYLNQEGISAISINSDRPQALREKALQMFRTNQCDVVVSTDVCARGIDVKDLDHVINLDLPHQGDYVTYIHRIGRTGRLKEGAATSFYDPQTDYDLAEPLVNGLKEASQLIPEFLLDAAENRPNYATARDEDDVWGATRRPIGLGQSSSQANDAGIGSAQARFRAGNGPASPPPPRPAAVENEDWE